MFSVKLSVVVAIVALTVGSVSATHRHLLQPGSCPVTMSALNLRDLVQPCSSSSSLCTGCLCALVDSFIPAYRAGGVDVNSEKPSSYITKMVGISQACLEGVDVNATLGASAANVENLTSCAVIANSLAGQDTTLPSCLTARALTAALDGSSMPGNNTVKPPKSPDNMTNNPTAPSASPAPSPQPTPKPPSSGADARAISIVASVGASMLAALLL